MPRKISYSAFLDQLNEYGIDVGDALQPDDVDELLTSGSVAITLEVPNPDYDESVEDGEEENMEVVYELSMGEVTQT